MTQISRSKIWVTGDVLTAADLNGEINVIHNDYNGSIDEDNLGTITGNVTWSYSGNVDGITMTKTGTGSGSLLDGSNAGTDPSLKINNTSSGDHVALSDSGTLAFTIEDDGTTIWSS
jgi:hypothetical protein|tara:strand:+ start:90 stop:440 length:351 start_codon:yes stop_codon:yes gene_type:complete